MKGINYTADLSIPTSSIPLFLVAKCDYLIHKNKISPGR